MKWFSVSKPLGLRLLDTLGVTGSSPVAPIREGAGSGLPAPCVSAALDRLSPAATLPKEAAMNWRSRFVVVLCLGVSGCFSAVTTPAGSTAVVVAAPPLTKENFDKV